MMSPCASKSNCACARTNRTVGKQRVAMQFGSFGGYISKLAKLLNGLWYSTPAEA